ncbi:MAG: hypothetical protein KBA81_02760 [Rhabdochlamydiaceae bacterium]|nr:hypothetical protein [Rhabdochlamydiaceae bacterium]
MKTTLLTSLLLLTSTACAEIHSATTVRHRESQGVGYNQGYSTLDYYLTSQHDKLEFLFNLRGHIFNDAKAAGNGGIAFRYSLKEDTSRIGANLYYDVRDSKHFIAQQIAGGLEWISKKIDVRMNGYLPVGKERSFSEHKFQGFTGNQVLVRRKLSGALPCMEGEVGTSLAKPFYFAAGTYYLFSDESHDLHLGKAWGWKARFDVEMGHYFSIGMLDTHDHIFNTRVQGYLGLNIPLGPWKNMKDGFKNLEKRRIVRNEIIPIQTKKKTKNPLSSDDESISSFLFVNNQAPFGGNGTFEHPFTSLKEAEAHSNTGDVIYVFPGDGTPRHMDEGIILKKKQILASSGSALDLDTVIIPALTPGLNPTITNIHTEEPVITNPGKSNVSNFYYMNPWEYMRLYESPMFFDSTSSSSFDSITSKDTPYSDSSIDSWVNLNPVPAASPDHSSSTDSGQGNPTTEMGNNSTVEK